MADAPTEPKSKRGKRGTGALEERLLALESRVADQDPREALESLKAQLAHLETLTHKLLQSVPRMVARAPVPLTHDEVKELVGSDHHTKFRSLTAVKACNLRPGDTFDPTAKFTTMKAFLSRIKGGKLKVARAA